MTDVLHSGEEAARRLEDSVVTIGNFDGMHRGHQAIFETTTRYADELETTSVGLTFEPHPEVFFRGDGGPERLSPPSHKYALMQRYGIDIVVALTFDESIAGLSPEDFVEQILADRLDARHVVVGRDFRFGKGRAGDTDQLKKLGESRGIGCSVEPFVVWEGEPVSSTRIREAVEGGRMEDAESMLGRPHRLFGRVVEGDKRGRQLGFPTANIDPREMALPPAGVYVTTLGRVDDPHWRAVTNIGTRPTFDGDERTIETFVLDDGVDQNELTLYGEDVELDIYRRIRGEREFDSPDELIARIKRDIGEARDFFEREGTDAGG